LTFISKAEKAKLSQEALQKEIASRGLNIPEEKPQTVEVPIPETEKIIGVAGRPRKPQKKKGIHDLEEIVARTYEQMLRGRVEWYCNKHQNDKRATRCRCKICGEWYVKHRLQPEWKEQKMAARELRDFVFSKLQQTKKDKSKDAVSGINVTVRGSDGKIKQNGKLIAQVKQLEVTEDGAIV
jgi:hypothetical protein